MSTILVELAEMSSIALRMRPTTVLVSSARRDALAANALASLAFCAFCSTVAVSSAKPVTVSSSDAACCSVRAERLALPAAISLDACRIESLDTLMLRTISER